MYYIGFFKHNIKKMMMFYSSKKPTRKQYPFFGNVMGPYDEQEAEETISILVNTYKFKKNPASTERQRKFMCAELGRKRAGKRTKTKMTDTQLSDFCRISHKHNPACNPKVISHRQALVLAKKMWQYAEKLYRHEQAGVKKYESNPGEQYHNREFMKFLKESDKYKVGSTPYIAAIAKAYEHLRSAQESVREVGV